MLKRKIRLIVYLSTLLLLIITNVTIFLVYSNRQLAQVPHDADINSNGNALFCTITLNEMLNNLDRLEEQIPVDPENQVHKIQEIDPEGNFVWEIGGLAYPHEVEELPNGHLLIADTGFDRVIEVAYPETDIVWSWEPAKINWTKVNPNWGKNHYYNFHNITFDWTHLNDVDFKSYGTWDACLISIRNFDLVVEVNYTAEKLGPTNNPENILWWYGDYQQHSLMYHQHNPDYLSTGNIIIADSENDRIIEVDKQTKAIVWKYDEGLLWPRDADELADGKLLITDTFNNRIFILDKEKKEILWEFSKDIISPYEADELANENILISGCYSGLILEVTLKGKIVWKYGSSLAKNIGYLNASVFLLMAFFGLFNRSLLFQLNNLKQKEKIRNIILICFLILLSVICLIVLIGYHFVIRTSIRIFNEKIINNFVR
ncbi:MAG: hypothetical protein GF308_06625 [Candidatus Heimdallarchaeota archaeon]|nr:hypothetical protein [Candidatus Heimdallarchaeota archaeon]